MLKKVVVIGPESTGKSTLTEELANHFSCPWVPEFAREYIEQLNRPYVYDDLLKIAKGQIQLEDIKSKQSQNLLICDTDLHVVQVWSSHKFGKVHDWVAEQTSHRKYDLYLLTNIDIPWQEDPQREHPDPEMRKYFFKLYKNLLFSKGLPFEVISGSPTERLQKGIVSIQRKLFPRGNFPSNHKTC
ncbi:ATP-binding protein [Cecembia sp.]|uniref:ATP-binding protein n=1 Tax=Cecembia sp. TaxID=1898110 RepID=UPI0025C5BA43|nr:ATP-binding protein [Cecembia sp.]